MKRFLSLVLLAAALCAAQPSYGWGQMGHDVVAAVAERHLTPKAKKHLNEILGGRSIVYYSSWLDNVQNSPYWRDGYDVTKTWHYANVDEGYTFETMPRNERGDVVSAVEMLSAALRSADELPDSTKVDYTRMLVHLVGDMHCPMHAGHLTDLGGNRVKVKWFGSQTNLHSVWDSKLIESAHKWSYTEWVEQIDRSTAARQRTIADGQPAEWFAETVAICDGIYASTTPESNLSYQYIYDYAPVAERQLLNAGYRLARLLNEIFG